MDGFIEKLAKAEVKKRGLPLAFYWFGDWWENPVPDGTLHPQDVLIGALQDAGVDQVIFNSKIFNDITKRFNRFKAVVQGYRQALPENKHQELYKYFGDKCRDTADVFMRGYSKNNSKANGPIEPELSAALRRFFPAEFIACMDENRFD